MIESEIRKNNRLIARFMGIRESCEIPLDLWDEDKYTSSDNCYCNEDQGAGYTFQDEHGDCSYCKEEKIEDFIENSKYHLSWNWLMPVVMKIESMIYNPETGYYDGILKKFMKETIFEEYDWYAEGHIFALAFSSFEELYNKVIKFIKWYNQNYIKSNIKENDQIREIMKEASKNLPHKIYSPSKDQNYKNDR